MSISRQLEREVLTRDFARTVAISRLCLDRPSFSGFEELSGSKFLGFVANSVRYVLDKADIFVGEILGRLNQPSSWEYLRQVELAGEAYLSGLGKNSHSSPN